MRVSETRGCPQFGLAERVIISITSAGGSNSASSRWEVDLELALFGGRAWIVDMIEGPKALAWLWLN
jgi:hypothetical protein